MLLEVEALGRWSASYLITIREIKLLKRTWILCPIDHMGEGV